MALVLKDHVANFGQAYSNTHRSETWVVTLEIQLDLWEKENNLTCLPDRGENPPGSPNAFPGKWNIPAGSTLLQRQVNFKARSGYVVVTLVYGYSFSLLTVNTGYAITRTIMTEMPITHAWEGDGTKVMVNGIVTPDVGEPVTTEYGIRIDGPYPTRTRMPFQLVRLIGLMDATQANNTAGVLLSESGSVNTHTATLLGKTIAVGQMKYLGSSIDLYRYSSPGNLLYRGYFDWLVHPYVWPREIKRVEYALKTYQAPVVDADGTKIGERPVLTRTAVSLDSTTYYTCKSYDFSTVQSLILTGA